MEPSEAADEASYVPANMCSLTDDLLRHVFANARLSALMHLKGVNRDFASLARMTLTRHVKWERARDISAKCVPTLWRNVGRLALLLDDVPTIEALLELGVMHADVTWFEVPETRDTGSGHRPLHLARSATMVALLVDDFGAPVDVRRGSGRTPLMDACNHGDVAVVRALCERGAKVNMLDSWDGVSGLPADHYAGVCAERGERDSWGDGWMLRACFPCADGEKAASAAELKAQFDAKATELDAYRRPLAGADGAGCARVLREFGVKAAHCSREQLWHASMDSMDDVPDEYVVGLH